MSKSIKVGYVRLRARGSGAWQVDWHDAASGLRQRKTIRATSEADARRQAKALSDAIASGQWQGRKRNDGPTVDQALEKTIQASNGNLKTRQGYAWHANRFLVWLVENYPAVKLWGELKTDMLRAYVAHNRERGLSRASQAHAIKPLKMTSRFWCENEPDTYRDTARPAKLPKDDTDPFEAAKQERRKALGPGELQAFLDFASAHRPDLYPVVLLQAFCGLRVLEALALREVDCDLVQGTIRVAATASHKPKTRDSYREIPVLPCVLSALRGVIQALPIGDRERCIFVRSSGKPWSGFHGYCMAVKKLLRECWREKGIEALRVFQAHWLRATFATGASAGGADTRVLQAYLGHSRGDILGRHYEQILIERMRAEVLPALEKWHKSGTTEKPAENRGAASATVSMVGGDQ